MMKDILKVLSKAKFSDLTPNDCAMVIKVIHWIHGQTEDKKPIATPIVEPIKKGKK